ncbi:hypothetical protein [Robertmurraya kyonggiensis]|uniref:Uncharacterized protein n=1 Tax=Robertmurraya kyonggiensis TaxID=1037680 RepID=A0A4U1D1S2_9BACI|nr:hypothetical protein [Robertmurraya kyonggiensis]TKC15683.1 hypothetical protein FA727_16285 [Robertmurraya kyonggiensis]
MPYQVVKSFFDLKDNKRLCEVGEAYPREGLEVDEARFTELSTLSNPRREIFIEKIESEEEPGIDGEGGEEFPKPTGGGWFLLSNGEKVQGEDKALAAEEALKGE